MERVGKQLQEYYPLMNFTLKNGIVVYEADPFRSAVYEKSVY
jgi:hypothetical protein